MRYPGFVGGSAPNQSVIATSERTMNFYPDIVSTEGPQNRRILLPTPGFQSWAGASAGISDTGGRGAIAIPGTTRAFAAIGVGVYELFSTQTVTRRTDIAQNSSPAQFCYNGPTGNQLLIASGNNAYLYNLTTNATTTVLTNEATQIGMLDEYFLALNANTGKLRLSALNDGTTWDPTQFALRSAQPDPWLAMAVNPPDIWLIGAETGEVWYDAGTSPFPLALRTGLAIPYGIAAKFSLQVTGGQVFWLAANRDGQGFVVKAQGYSPQKISTPELDTAISTYQRTSTIADAEGLVYQQEGHTFYVLRFPTVNATWVYDLNTQEWHERGSWNSAANRYDVWHPRFHVFAFGLHLTGESATSTVSAMDVTYGSEADGSAIRRQRRGAVWINELRRVPINRFELCLETGVGLSTGQGSNPQVMFRGSPDGGKTWNSERLCAAGALGNYTQRVYWTRCGSPRMWVPEVTFSDPIPWRIVDAYLNNN